VALARLKRVAPFPAYQEVVAQDAADPIIARTAVQRVAPIFAPDRIVAGAALHEFVARAAARQVAAGSAVRSVIRSSVVIAVQMPERAERGAATTGPGGRIASAGLRTCVATRPRGIEAQTRQGARPYR
jgi:hypothetical protein